MGGAPEPEDLETDIFRARFEAAFDAHHAHVLAFALRRVDGRAMAEDAVSETFAVVWQKRDLIPAEPLGWIYAIARRVIANQRRSDPAAVSAVFASLSEIDQEVLRLVAWDEVSTTEGAQILDCTPATFRVHLHRARRAFQRALEEAATTQEFRAVAQSTPSTAQGAR